MVTELVSPTWNSEYRGRLVCDEAGNGVDLGVQNVPKWGSEIADSRAVWHLCGTVAELAKHMNPKRLLAGTRGR